MHWEFSMHLARQGIAPGALTRGDADAVVRNALPIGSVPRRRFLVADGERRAGPTSRPNNVAVEGAPARPSLRRRLRLRFRLGLRHPLSVRTIVRLTM
jgi:hypothetical protein